MRTIKYGSICSGIEAATVAWSPLGWKPAWFAEIDAFPCELLSYRYPGVTNHGDFTKITKEQSGPIDLLCGGTPCQDFSVAGLRAGLDGARGNLTLEFVALAGRLRPRWLVWENVPGVLSIDEGRAFGAFLGRLAECGYGFAYRVLDAQYFGVPQRRRRVFVVGYLGDWRPPAAVLIERESFAWSPAPSREKREEVAGTLGGGSGSRGWCPDTDRMTFAPEVGYSLNAHGGSGRSDGEFETFVASIAAPLTSNPYGDHESRESLLVAHSLRSEGFDASEDGTGRGIPLVPMAYPILEAGARTGKSTDEPRAGIGIGQDGDPMYTLQAAKQHAIAFTERGREQGRTIEHQEELSYCLTNPGSGGRTHSRQVMTPQMAVRRLTPRECERLQGFPDDWTLIPRKNGKLAADSPRYKAIGNSWAVPVARWIGQRIQAVEDIINA